MIYKKAENYLLINDKMQNMFQYIDKGSIATIITDPPYELNFMSKGWDRSGVAFQEDTWKHCYDALKDGGYLIVFGGSRTFHRVACAIEDAGFEIRDTMMWLYGSGFPKSQNVGKQIDAREKYGKSNSRSLRQLEQEEGTNPHIKKQPNNGMMGEIKEFVRKDYQSQNKWNGWGTTLKPAFEPIIVARKPFKGSLTDNVIKNGVGAINIDECRVENSLHEEIGRNNKKGSYVVGITMNKSTTPPIDSTGRTDLGRFPANVITDGSDEVAMGMPNTKSTYNENANHEKTIHRENAETLKYGYKERIDSSSYNDEGSAMRYFYTAKASKKDRDEGLDMFESFKVNDGRQKEINNPFQRGSSLRKNIHPTVKPVDLMQYLVRLFTPKGETIMDCFMGSGSTGKATMFENRERQANYKFVGIEMTDEYLPICEARIDYALNKYEYEIEKENAEDKENGIMNIFDFM